MIYLNGKNKTIASIRADIKNGATIEDFTNFFGVSNQEFLDALKKKIGNGLREYTFLLNKNEKKRKGTTENKAEVKKEEMKQIDRNIKEQPTNNREIELEAMIESLTEEHTKISKAFEKIDAEGSENKAKQEEVRIQLQDYLTKVSGLKEELEVLMETKRKIDITAEKTLEALTLTEEKLNLAKKELEEYRVVQLYYDASGLSHIPVETAKEQVTALYVDLSDDEDYSCYPAKDIKAVATILTAVATLKNAGKKYIVATEKCTENIRNMLEYWLATNEGGLESA